VVSEGRPDAALPGLEPSPDPLLQDVHAALGTSRQQELAHDVGEPVPHARVSDPFAAGRDARRRADRLVAQSTAAASARADAELRLGALEAELEATSMLRRSTRAELREAIERQRAVVDLWQSRAVSLADPVSLPASQPASRDALDPPGHELSPVPPVVDYVDDLELGM
jgi:hypothetical protein